MDCNICFECHCFFTVPQCRKEHMICMECAKHVKHCPFCRNTWIPQQQLYAAPKYQDEKISLERLRFDTDPHQYCMHRICQVAEELGMLSYAEQKISLPQGASICGIHPTRTIVETDDHRYNLLQYAIAKEEFENVETFIEKYGYHNVYLQAFFTVEHAYQHGIFDASFLFHTMDCKKQIEPHYIQWQHSERVKELKWWYSQQMYKYMMRCGAKGCTNDELLCAIKAQYHSVCHVPFELPWNEMLENLIEREYLIRDPITRRLYYQY